jgi:hypothetical protein
MATRLWVNPATKELPVFVGYKGFQVFFPGTIVPLLDERG